MPEGANQEDPRLQAEAARKAFEQEFERFARLGAGPGQGVRTAAGELSAEARLLEAEATLRELSDLRSRHTGKKSALASVKKMIGRVPAEERASFGQLVQQIEADITRGIDEAESQL